MELSETRRDGVLILELKGRLDAETSPMFEGRLLGHIRQGERRIVLQGSGLDYVSSSGLRALLMADRLLKDPPGKIVVCGLMARIERIFQITGFSSIFPVHESLEEAVRGFEER
jgi:anti-anti-sigma factor